MTLESCDTVQFNAVYNPNDIVDRKVRNS